MKKRSNQEETTKAVTATRKKKKRDMNSRERVQILQRKLYLKAKQEKAYKFYVLYDKVFIPYILSEAWRRVKTNNGSAGVDGQTIVDIESAGVATFLAALGEDLRKQTYHPQPVKRVEITKSNGGTRPLGIPTVRDRVAQMACKLVIEPIFEADFTEDSFGFRPKRSASGAIKAIKSELYEGKTEVYDADLSKYFDTIPHDKLEIAIRQRISDKRIIDLIKKWLRSPVRGSDGQDRGGRKVKVGTPQGGVISPLLSNIYLNLLDRIVASKSSLFGRSGVRIIRYADDFVLMGQRLSVELKNKLNELLTRMGLGLNEQKSKVVNAKETSFDFLGFTFRSDKCLYNPKTHRFWNVHPSKKSEKKIRQKIKTKLASIGHFRPEAVVRELNKLLVGWLNYFDVPRSSYTKMAKRRLRFYLKDRLRRYYNRKSQRKSRLYRQQVFEKLVAQYGLIDPTRFAR